MRNLRKKEGILLEDFKYFPMFFESMISFLSYKLNRDNSLDALKVNVINLLYNITN